MNHQALIDTLKKLNLEPGIYRFELPEYEIVITVRSRKARDDEPSAERLSESMTVDPVTIDESCIMLEPWVEFPEPSGGFISVSHLGEPDLPDIPEIPAEDDGE
jgi:hypothetical protein